MNAIYTTMTLIALFYFTYIVVALDHLPRKMIYPWDIVVIVLLGLGAFVLRWAGHKQS